jgi:hypothetical protein
MIVISSCTLQEVPKVAYPRSVLYHVVMCKIHFHIEIKIQDSANQAKGFPKSAIDPATQAGNRSKFMIDFRHQA